MNVQIGIYKVSTMISIISKSIRYVIVLLVVLFQPGVYADVPDVQTPAPVIYLKYNLDEEDNLGWCIDTVGRGFGEKIHSHSCKPTGGDVQFDFNAGTGNIESVEYINKCLTIVENTIDKPPFGLLDCIADQQAQQFTYDAESLQFHPSDNESLCIAVAPTIRKAGPFMSRDLVLSDCNETDPKLMQWIVKKA